MELYIDVEENSPSEIYSSQQTSQDKMIIRIKKQESYIENKKSPNNQDNIALYTCEFVDKVETKSELCDKEPMEIIRQDENFIYPAITNSDDEDISDTTWLPKIKRIKCLNSSANKPIVTLNNALLRKNSCNSLTPKVTKPRKRMITPKQRLGRIIKIHKMMK